MKVSSGQSANRSGKGERSPLVSCAPAGNALSKRGLPPTLSITPSAGSRRAFEEGPRGISTISVSPVLLSKPLLRRVERAKIARAACCALEDRFRCASETSWSREGERVARWRTAKRGGVRVECVRRSQRYGYGRYAFRVGSGR